MQEKHINEGFTLLKSALNSAAERLGDASDVIFATALLYGFAEARMCDEGIEFADRIIRKHQALKVETLPGNGRQYLVNRKAFRKFIG